MGIVATTYKPNWKWTKKWWHNSIFTKTLSCELLLLKIHFDTYRNIFDHRYWKYILVFVFKYYLLSTFDYKNWSTFRREMGTKRQINFSSHNLPLLAAFRYDFSNNFILKYRHIPSSEILAVTELGRIQITKPICRKFFLLLPAIIFQILTWPKSHSSLVCYLRRASCSKVQHIFKLKGENYVMAPDDEVIFSKCVVSRKLK